MRNKRLRNIIFTGLLVAVGIVLTYLLSFSYPPGQVIIRFGIGYLPLIIISILFGPGIGALAGAAQDILGYFLLGTNTGPYFPGFTINAILFGIIPGLIYRVKNKGGNIFLKLNYVFLTLILIPIIYSFFNVNGISSNINISTAVRYILLSSALVAILLILLYVWTQRKKDNSIQKMIFIVIVMIFVESVVLTPLWVYLMSYLAMIPVQILFWTQIPLRIVKLPVEIFIYSFLLIELNTLIKWIRSKTVI